MRRELIALQVSREGGMSSDTAFDCPLSDCSNYSKNARRPSRRSCTSRRASMMSWGQRVRNYWCVYALSTETRFMRMLILYL